MVRDVRFLPEAAATQGAQEALVGRDVDPQVIIFTHADPDPI